MFWVAIVLAISALDLVSSTVVNNGEPIFCSRANITEVRIQGCNREPCNLKKGTRLPIEIDFSFQAPKSTNEIQFTAFIPYWNKPGTGAYGSYLASGSDCKGFQLRECPAKSGQRYTLKTTLYADPKLQSTVGNHETTGKVRTGWMLTPNDRNKSGSNGYSQCSFNVEINIVQ